MWIVDWYVCVYAEVHRKCSKLKHCSHIYMHVHPPPPPLTATRYWTYSGRSCPASRPPSQQGCTGTRPTLLTVTMIGRTKSWLGRCVIVSFWFLFLVFERICMCFVPLSYLLYIFCFGLWTGCQPMNSTLPFVYANDFLLYFFQPEAEEMATWQPMKNTAYFSCLREWLSLFFLMASSRTLKKWSLVFCVYFVIWCMCSSSSACASNAGICCGVYVRIHICLLPCLQ